MRKKHLMILTKEFGGVILEGADGTGKSTIAKSLEHEFGWPVIHVTQPANPNIDQMFALAKARPVIFDRFHVSPVVYGKVLRGKPDYNEEQFFKLDSFLRSYNFILVHCTTALAQMVENNHKVHQLFPSVRITKICADLDIEFTKWIAKSCMYNFEFDYKRMSIGLLIGRVYLAITNEGRRPVEGGAS